MGFNTVDCNVFKYCTLETVFNSWIFFSFQILSPVLVVGIQIWFKQMALGIARYKFGFIEVLLVQTALASLIISHST